MEVGESFVKCASFVSYEHTLVGMLGDLSSKMSGLNVNAASFVPNVNAPVFVPTFATSSQPPPPPAQTPVVSLATNSKYN